MADDEPDSALIDAWLAGELSPQEAAELEQYFGDESVEAGASGERIVGDDDIFEGLDADGVTDDPVLSELMERITQHGLPTDEPRTSSPDAWREVLEPYEGEEQGLIGMLGHYEVLEVIAVGGMGLVFKARDPELDRLAALKVLAPDLAANATARERFLREARAAAKLEHENILSIYGVVDAGIPWFAMRYTSGGTLQDRIDRGEDLGFDQLKSIAKQVAAALEVAHDRGLVHRDIKPANLLFDEAGDHLWVCDFGIARSSEDPSLTYPGAIAGTPQFMSPEQAAGRELDGRSDLFSLGAVLYRTVVGKHAFAGETTASVLLELGGDGQLKIDRKNSGVPKWFWRLLNNLLAKDPDDRPQDAAAIVRAIDDEYSPPPKHRVRRNRRIATVAALMSATLLVVLSMSRLSAVEHAVNRLLGARYEQAIFIADRYGAYPDLRSAISEARDGDTIELPGGDPLAIDNLLIHPGKSLSLVALDPEFRPRLTTDITGATGLVSRSSLHLSGIDFLLNMKPGGDAILVVDGASARLEDCRFRAEIAARYSDVNTGYRAIELRGGGVVDFAGCDLHLPKASAVAVAGQSSAIRIRDSRVVARYGVDVLAYGESEASPLRLDLQGQRFAGSSFLRVAADGPLPGVTANARDCEFVCDRPLCWFVTNRVAEVQSGVKWTGSGNTYPLGNSVAQIGTGLVLADRGRVIPIEALDGRETAVEPPMIVIESTGETFSDLRLAINKAPADATLLLSGRFELTDYQTISRRGKPVHFRANPRSPAQPTIVAMGENNHGLFLIGPVTFSGIRFVRYDSTGAWPLPVPVLGVIGEDPAEVLIEDCEFSVLPGVTNANSGPSVEGRCLSITNAGSATVRRCVFRGGVGIFAAFAVDKTGDPLLIRIEDCIFVGTNAIMFETDVTPTRLEVSVSRCVVIGEHFLSMPGRSEMNREEVMVEDCIIDLDGPLLRYPDRSFDQLKGKLTWNGKNNFYRHSKRQFDNPSVAKGVAAYSLAADMTLQQLLEQLPGSNEANPGFGEPFDRSQIGAAVMPRDLLKALQPGVEGPALAVLKKMAE